MCNKKKIAHRKAVIAHRKAALLLIERLCYCTAQFQQKNQEKLFSSAFFFLLSLLHSFLWFSFVKMKMLKRKRKIKSLTHYWNAFFWQSQVKKVSRVEIIDLSMFWYSIRFDWIRCSLKMESKNSYSITSKDTIDWDVDDLSK